MNMFIEWFIKKFLSIKFKWPTQRALYDVQLLFFIVLFAIYDE